MRQTVAAVGGLTRWSKIEDPASATAATAPARQAVRERIAQNVDPTLTGEERERAIEDGVREFYREAGRKGGAARRKPRTAGKPPRAERLAAAQSSLAAEQLAAHIQKVADAASALTVAQKEKLASLLRPASGTAVASLLAELAELEPSTPDTPAVDAPRRRFRS